MISEDALLKKISLRLIPFMFLLYIVSYLDRVNVSFAALQMNQALHFSAEVYSFAAGIFFIAYFLLEVPSNLIVHRVGARLWITRIMVNRGNHLDGDDVREGSDLFLRAAISPRCR